MPIGSRMDNSRNRRETRGPRSPSTSPDTTRRSYIPPIPPSRSSGRIRASYSSRYGASYSSRYERSSGDIVLDLEPPSFEESQNHRILESSLQTTPIPPPRPRETPLPHPGSSERTGESREALLRRQIRRFFPDDHRISERLASVSAQPLTPPRSANSVSPPTLPVNPANAETPSPTRRATRRIETSINRLADRFDDLSLRIGTLENNVPVRATAWADREAESDGSDQATAWADRASTPISIPLPFGIGDLDFPGSESGVQEFRERISRIFFFAILNAKEQDPDARISELWERVVQKVKQTFQYNDDYEVQRAFDFVFGEGHETLFPRLVSGSLPEIYWRVYSYDLSA